MKTPNAKPRADHLLVYADIAATDRTESGLYIPDWQPGDKDATKAVVVATPLSLSAEAQLGFPDMDGRRYFYSDLQDLPAVGETVYLRPNTFKAELEYPGYPGVFLINLDRVVASKGEDGLLRPFQGLLLCEEVWDDNVYQRQDGSRYTLHRFKSSAHPYADESNPPPLVDMEMVSELDPLPIDFTLRILHVGTPLRGQEDVVQVDDVIAASRKLFAHHAVKNKDDDEGEGKGRWRWEAPMVNIEGKDYACIPRQMVMGKRS